MAAGTEAARVVIARCAEIKIGDRPPAIVAAMKDKVKA